MRLAANGCRIAGELYSIVTPTSCDSAPVLLFQQFLVDRFNMDLSQIDFGFFLRFSWDQQRENLDFRPFRPFPPRVGSARLFQESPKVDGWKPVEIRLFRPRRDQQWRMILI